MAQAIGRAQRVCKFEPGVELRVFTYSLCGTNKSRGPLSAEKSVARRLQVAHEQMALTHRRDFDKDMETASKIIRDKIDMYKSIVRQMEMFVKILKDLEGKAARSSRVPMSSIDAEILDVIIGIRKFNVQWKQTILEQAIGDCAPASRRVGGNINWLKRRYPDTGLSDTVLDRALNGQDSPYVEHLPMLLESTQEEMAEAVGLMERNSSILKVMEFMIKSRYRYAMGYIEPGAGIDEMIAAVYTRQFEPMRTLLRALAITSVSCDLYRDLHSECGQLAGLPGYDDLLVDLPCGDPATVADDPDVDMKSKVREEASVVDPDGDSDKFVASMMRIFELAMSDAYEICGDDSLGDLQSECSDSAVKNPKHPLFVACRQFKSCKKIKVVGDEFDAQRPRKEPPNYDAIDTHWGAY